MSTPPTADPSRFSSKASFSRGNQFYGNGHATNPIALTRDDFNLDVAPRQIASILAPPGRRDDEAAGSREMRGARAGTEASRLQVLASDESKRVDRHVVLAVLAVPADVESEQIAAVH